MHTPRKCWDTLMMWPTWFSFLMRDSISFGDGFVPDRIALIVVVYCLVFARWRATMNSLVCMYQPRNIFRGFLWRPLCLGVECVPVGGICPVQLG